MKKTRLARTMGMLLTSFLVAGCPASKPVPDVGEAGHDNNKVVIRGSNTFGEELGPHLISQYKQDHPKADFDLQPKGTAYGMGALMGGMCDIAGASRPPLKEELEVAQFRNVELHDHVIGAYSVAVVLNVANPVANLTTNQIQDIFTGAVQNWKDLGGPDAPIHLYIRDPISGTYLGFKEIAMGNKPYADNHNLFTNYIGIVGAVAQDPNGIGYSSFNLLKAEGIKGVSINGVLPTTESVNKGEYPYARMLHLYTSKGREDTGTLDFIQFILSPKGQEALAQAGYVPKS